MYLLNSRRIRAQPPMVRRLTLPVSAVKYLRHAIAPNIIAMKIVISYSGKAPA
jgi:hypothetical protein